MKNYKESVLEKKEEISKIRYFYTSYKTCNLSKILTHNNDLGNLPNSDWVYSEIKRLNYNCVFEILELSVEISKAQYDELDNLPDSFTLN